MSGYTFDLRDLARRARQYDDEQALTDAAAAAIEKVLIIGDLKDAEAWLARYREAKQQ